jgi:hypothetical protein
VLTRVLKIANKKNKSYLSSLINCEKVEEQEFKSLRKSLEVFVNLTGGIDKLERAGV